ncbi:hypothetical protein [Engelhardtia mirabilis]|uniref:hypothetical protein n=1 Tax=Engelhardtia mirabilis TaxID=2528011 RepID=UPI003AF367A2
MRQPPNPGHRSLSPSGELLLDAIEHYGVGVENWNVATWPSDNMDYVAFGEWHAPRSPYLTPPTIASGSVTLYSEENFQGHRVELDPVDFYYEDWTHFSTLPGPCAGAPCDFSNAVQSLSWRLPPGVTVKLWEDEGFDEDDLPLGGIGSLANLNAYPDFIQDVASLSVRTPDLLWNRFGMHLLNGGEQRQVSSFDTSALLLLPLIYKPTLIEFEAGNDAKPLGLIDFPTQLRTLEGSIRIE